MALYGEARDISFFRHVNRELMGNIISEQVVYYKYKLAETKVNMYGEAAEGRNFMAPVTLNALIERSEQEFPESDLGVDINWHIIIKFLRDAVLPLKDKNPEIYIGKTAKQMKKQSSDLYNNFTPELITPKLKDYLKQFKAS